MNETTFAGVVAGREAVLRVAEDEDHLAFLAPRPFRPGHVIVIPKRVHDQLFELPAAEHAALWAFAREVARHIKSALPCERVCAFVVGWAVRHAHIHLVPTDAQGQVPGLDGEPLPAAELARLRDRLGARQAPP